MNSLFSESGRFFGKPIDRNHFMIYFYGDDDFINRSKNLVINYGIGKIFSRGYCRDMFSVSTTKENFINKLSLFFSWEIIKNHKKKIKYSVIESDSDLKVDWDENKLQELSIQMAKKFWDSKIEDAVFLEHFKSNDIFLHEFSVNLPTSHIKNSFLSRLKNK